MCGRFTLTWPSAPELARILGVSPSDAFSLLYRPRWNVAPTDSHWVVRLAPGSGDRQLAPATWGFTAPPSSSGARRGPLINARSETATRMPGVRDAFTRRTPGQGRCIVPVDGFYEWVGAPKAKRPIWFSAASGDLLRFAGLWEAAASGEGARFTILTTAANDVVAPIHDRMPVIVAASDVDAWLAGEPTVAASLLRSAPVTLLEARAVTPRANSVKNDDRTCLDPWDPTLDIDLREASSSASAKHSSKRGKPPRTPKRAVDAGLAGETGLQSKNATLPLFGSPLLVEGAVPKSR